MFRRAPYTYKRIILKKEDRAMFAFDLDLQKKKTIPQNNESGL